MIRILRTWSDAYLFCRIKKSKNNPSGPDNFETILLSHGNKRGTIIDNKLKSALEICDILRLSVPNLHLHKQIRIASCYSAFNTSLNISNILQNSYIKGYASIISTHFDPEILNKLILYAGKEEAERKMDDSISWKRLCNIKRHFHSVTFYRGSVVREKFQNPEGLMRTWTVV